MELHRRRVLSLGLVGLLGAATACTRAPAPPVPAPATSPTIPTPAAPRPFVIGAPGQPHQADPFFSWDSETFRLSRQQFDTLLSVNPQTGEPAPGLAREHRVSSDLLTHTFLLEPGRTFSDGSPCDAAAVVANVQRWSRPAAPDLAHIPSPFVSVFGGFPGETRSRFAQVTASSSHTVRLRLSAPLEHLPAALTSPQFGLVSPASWGSQDTVARPASDAAGTGPYRRASVEEVGAMAHEHPALVDTDLLVPVAPDADDAELGPVAVAHWGRASTRLRELSRGTADVMDVVTPGQLRRLVETGAQVLQRDPLSVLYLGMNLEHPVLDQLYARRAIAHGVDRPALARSGLFLEGSSMAHDLVPPPLGVDADGAERYDVNPERARSYLALAGYEGQPLEFLYPAGWSRPSLPEPEKVYARIAADLSEVGLNIVPVPIPADADYLEAILSRPSRALHLMSRDGLYRDPHAFLEPVSRSFAAETAYANARVLRLLDDAADDSGESRLETFAQICRSVSLDLPVLPLVYPISAVAIGERVQSYPTSPQLDEHWRDIRA
ncbi:MAG: ABC transporter substrate-binding protein [Micrococcus sp.]|nr:ABC transporter substrate-binding protein [Micrococcus sp.]